MCEYASIFLVEFWVSGAESWISCQRNLDSESKMLAGFRILEFDSGSRTQESLSRTQRFSGFCIPQGTIFRIPDFTSKDFLESGLPCMGPT